MTASRTKNLLPPGNRSNLIASAFTGKRPISINMLRAFVHRTEAKIDLRPIKARQTWDVTLYAGARLWEGAELWINPEIVQGFGLSSTLGIAGFTSGEAYKVGATIPYARIPRMFMRQTINLGGESQKVAADTNQFANTQSSDRLVTVGKFWVNDVFDTNKFAHDPRKDFMNWALIDTGTFDYAADAWGYTYGAAIEWYRGPWTVRGGLFDLSVVPNSSQLDPQFKQFQWVGVAYATSMPRCTST